MEYVTKSSLDNYCINYTYCMNYPTSGSLCSNSIYHILMPQNYIEQIEITVPNFVSMNEMNSKIGEILQEQYDNANIHVFDVCCLDNVDIENADKTIRYGITFIQIPYELLEKLMYRGICRAIFYVTSSQINQEFYILDERPLDSEMAFLRSSYNGVLTPYSTGIIQIV